MYYSRTTTMLNEVELCLSNVLFGKRDSRSNRFRDTRGVPYRFDFLTGLLTPVDEEIEQENKRRSIYRTRDIISKILHCNVLPWFVTLTFELQYNNKQRRKIWDNFRKYMRRQGEEVQYLGVEEVHKGGGAADGLFHYHFLMSENAFKVLGFIDSGFVVCHRYKVTSKVRKEKYEKLLKRKYKPKGTDGQTIYTVTSFKKGNTTAIRVTDLDIAYDYITKYITKDTSYGLRKKRYWCSKNLVRPSVVSEKISKGNYLTGYKNIRDLAINYLKRKFNIDINDLAVKIVSDNEERQIFKIRVYKEYFEAAKKAKIFDCVKEERENKKYYKQNTLRNSFGLKRVFEHLPF